MPVANRSAMQHGFAVLALTLLMVCIWSVTHHYHDLSADAALYAVRALAKLQPWFAHDIYLQYASLDGYTVFTWFYAKLIAAAGLHQAERALYVVCSAWFLAAAWALMRRLSDSFTAWLSVLLLVILVGRYGSYNVFRFAEEFLTARSLAEAMVVTAIAFFYGGARRWALAIAAGALFIHPLMALPGLLLLLCLWAGARIGIVGALGGILITVLLAVGVRLAAQATGPFALMDATWLAVVVERSQFLFLQMWRLSDWAINALPFATLGLTLLVVPDQRMRQLAFAAMLVGASGLIVAFLAGTIGPAAILLQGQPWRWVWITSFTGILLLAPTLVWMWRDRKCGPACAILLIGGWTCVSMNIWVCIALTAFLWLLRAHLSDRVAYLLRWLALLLAAVQVAWAVVVAWAYLRVSTPDLARSILGMRTTVLLVSGLAWCWIGTRRSPWGPAIACAVLATTAAVALPGAVPISQSGTPADFNSYADWRGAMPVQSNVAVVGVRSSVGFVWFTLDRSDYLSIDQSAGVVFSRATALEVERRSHVLEPLVQPTWKIMSYLAREARGEKVADEKDGPLTAPALVSMCRDAQLDFVIAHEYVGFDALRHTQAGPYKDWYLYDCRRVRAPGRPV